METFVEFDAVAVAVMAVVGFRENDIDIPVLDIEDVRSFLYGMFPDSLDKVADVGFIGGVLFFVSHSTPPMVLPHLVKSPYKTKTAWRVTSKIEANLGGCVSAIADSVGKVGSTYYICKSGSWTTATALEYDTYKWSAGKDGDSKVGSVNAGNCYVLPHLVKSPYKTK